MARKVWGVFFLLLAVICLGRLAFYDPSEPAIVLIAAVVSAIAAYYQFRNVTQ